jgi:vitamin K-dependent gamma-carboxylase
MTVQRNLGDRLFSRVDAASLAVFRIGFGIIMLVEMWRYYNHGWITRYYVTTKFHFTYYGFDWVQPWSETGMYLHFAGLALLAFFITIGFLYRFSIIAFTLGFIYVFLLDQTQYLNHFYLVILLGVLLCFLPAQRAFSVDARLRRRPGPATVPAWSVWALRAQFEVLYLYAGLVKINADWLQLEPMAVWMARGAGLPMIGPLMTEPLLVAVASYGVIILHLVGAPLLLWRRTRLAVFLIYATFHFSNHISFNIGIFPWLTLFGTLIFFEPDWPRRVWRSLSGQSGQTPQAVPGSRDGLTAAKPAALSPFTRRLTIGILTGWLAFQVLFPLRHFLYPGNVSWTEEGHRFSWQMMLRDKDSMAKFIVTDPASGKVWRVNSLDYLNSRQIRKMAGRPDMLLQFAHQLAREWETGKNLPGVEVRVETAVSLNGRPQVPLVDPDRNLATVSRDLGHADWILPLTEPQPAATFRRLLD